MVTGTKLYFFPLMPSCRETNDNLLTRLTVNYTSVFSSLAEGHPTLGFIVADLGN